MKVYSLQILLALMLVACGRTENASPETITDAIGNGPDRISYSTFRAPAFDVFKFGINGEVTQLTNNDALDYGGAVSPDGEWLVFTSERDGSPDLFAKRIDAPDSPAVKLIESIAMEDQAAFSPDGSKLVFVSTAFGTSDLFEIDFDPSQTVELDAANRLTTHDRAELRPAYAPDGSGLYFTSNRDAVDRGHPAFPFAILTFGDLYFLSFADGLTTRLTEADGWDGAPNPSSTDGAVYFYSERDGGDAPRIYRMQPDGGSQEKIAIDEFALAPSVRSDGSILYSHIADDQNAPPDAPPQWEIRLFSEGGETSVIDTGDVYCFEPKAINGSDAFICNGFDRSFYASEADIGAFAGPILALGFPVDRSLNNDPVKLFGMAHAFSVPLHPHEAKIVRPGPIPLDISVQALPNSPQQFVTTFRPSMQELFPERRRVIGLTWSGDGNKIAFSLKAFRETTVAGDIWTVNVDGSDLINLTDGSVAAAGMPDFGQNDQKIVFAGRSGDATDLYIMNTDGTEITNMTNSPDVRENFPALSADGTMLAYSSDRDGVLDPATNEKTMDIYVVETGDDGKIGEPRQITSGRGQKAHPRFSPDGKWLVYTSGVGDVNDEYPLIDLITFTPQLYGEIFAYNLETGESVRLTHDKWEDGAPYWTTGTSKN